MRILLIILVLFSIGFLVRHVRISDTHSTGEEKTVVTKSQPMPQPAAVVAPAPAASAQPKRETNQKVRELAVKIEKLQNESDELKHSLEMQGFPQILNGDRLSETERDQIVQQANQLTELNIRIVHLKNQKVEMETEVDL